MQNNQTYWMHLGCVCVCVLVWVRVCGVHGKGPPPPRPPNPHTHKQQSPRKLAPVGRVAQPMHLHHRPQPPLLFVHQRHQHDWQQQLQEPGVEEGAQQRGDVQREARGILRVCVGVCVCVCVCVARAGVNARAVPSSQRGGGGGRGGALARRASAPRAQRAP